MSSVYLPVHHSDSMDDLLEDPFDDELEETFPPMRYCSTYQKPAIQQKKIRRASSIERSRLYRELVGHDPYYVRPNAREASTAFNKGDFRLSLDVSHYRPEEITIKVEGQTLKVCGKHYNSTNSGYEASEFERNYIIPDDINTRSLTSTITPDGVLLIKAFSQKTHATPELTILTSDENSSKFEVTLDVHDFKPSEIFIHVNDRYLIVNGEKKDEENSVREEINSNKETDNQNDDTKTEEKLSKRFERHFSLPTDVDCELLSSRYRDGKITIEAPRKNVASQMRKLEIQEE